MESTADRLRAALGGFLTLSCGAADGAKTIGGAAMGPPSCEQALVEMPETCGDGVAQAGEVCFEVSDSLLPFPVNVEGIPEGISPGSQVVADLDLDGRAEIVALFPRELTVLEMSDDGNVRVVPTTFPAELKPLAAGLLMASADPVILATTTFPEGTAPGLVLLTSEGSAWTIAETLWEDTDSQVECVTGDFDGDATRDVLCWDGTESRLWLGADAAMPVSLPYEQEWDWSVRGVEDVDHDGTQDVAFAGDGVLLLGDAADPLERFVLAPLPYLHGSILADLDGDGHVDIIESQNMQLHEPSQFWRGHGDGTFDAEPSPSPLLKCGASYVHDFTGDGLVDLVPSYFIRAEGDELDLPLRISVNGGEGEQPTNVRVPDTNGAPALADFDGDGRLDFFVTKGHAYGFARRTD
jgi:hypothetical protein